MSPPLRTYLVTGANRGIGLSICRILLAHPPPARDPIRLIATSRPGKTIDLTPGPGDEILYRDLDISQPDSITLLAASLSTGQTSDHGIDVLINNAGVNIEERFDPSSAATDTLAVNYHGTKAMCTAFLPQLRRNSTPAHPSRIVNLSSVASQLKPYAPEIQARFRSATSTLTIPELDALVREYVAAAGAEREAEAGFAAAGRAYAVSKAAVNALTMVLARSGEAEGVLVNACCPGWVSTEMGRMVGRAPKTDEEGAKVPVRLARGDIGGVTGRYWANQSVRGKGEGEVREW